MKSLDFNRGAGEICRPRMSRRAWYVVFGAERLQPGQITQAVDVAQRLHTVYDDIDPVDIMEVMETYAIQRNQSIRGEK